VRPLLAVLGLVVTGVCLYLALRGVAFADMADALRASDLVWLLPAIPVFGVAIVLRGVRWWALYHDENRPPLRAVMYGLLVGYFFNNILPARAGEAARIIALHSRARSTPRAEIIATVVVERVFDLLALLALLLCAYPWLPEISWLRNAAILGAIVTVGLAVVIVLIVRYDARAVHWLLSPLRRINRPGFAERVEAAAINATRGLVALRNPVVAVRGFALTIASWFVLAISYWILMQAFHLDLPLTAAVLVTVAINLSLVLPSSPAALGVFEAATIIALNAWDVPRAEALSYALILHLFNLVPFLVIGALLLGPAALRRER
jgi:uncharacterized protein (TIRG00374 family)